MSDRSLSLDDNLYKYLLDVSLREPDVMAKLRQATATHPHAGMQIGPEQGQFMGLLARLIGANSYLEVGTFTGYSALAMASAMPDTAEIVCCDVSEEFTTIAREFWAEAGVADRIALHLAPAEQTLEQLITEGRSGAFDMMFIDADKENYDRYFELGLRLVRPGGLIMIDNVLWSGAVIDPGATDADTQAIRALNTKIAGDARVDISMIPIGDGLTLVRKL